MQWKVEVKLLPKKVIAIIKTRFFQHNVIPVKAGCPLMPIIPLPPVFALSPLMQSFLHFLISFSLKRKKSQHVSVIRKGLCYHQHRQKRFYESLRPSQEIWVYLPLFRSGQTLLICQSVAEILLISMGKDQFLAVLNNQILILLSILPLLCVSLCTIPLAENHASNTATQLNLSYAISDYQSLAISLRVQFWDFQEIDSTRSDTRRNETAG